VQYRNRIRSKINIWSTIGYDTIGLSCRLLKKVNFIVHCDKKRQKRSSWLLVGFISRCSGSTMNSHARIRFEIRGLQKVSSCPSAKVKRSSKRTIWFIGATTEVKFYIWSFRSMVISELWQLEIVIIDDYLKYKYIN
jgi:hypothetical protein